MTTTADNWRQHDRQAGHRADLPLRASAPPTSSCVCLLLPRQPQRHQLRPALAAARRHASRSRRPIRRRSEPIDPRTTTARRATTTRRYAVATARPAHPPLRRRRRAADAAPPGALRARPARQHDPLLHARDIGDVQRIPVAPTQRRSACDDADPRHQQQGAGPDDHLRPERLQQQVQLARAPQRGAHGRRLRARGVQQLHA